jgi:hypothetical protein
MNTEQKRIALFLFGCLGARALLVWLAKTGSAATLRLLGLFALAVALGFFVIYFKGWRKTGPEVFGQQIWWNDLRPIHGTLYLIFAILALRGYEKAWTFLAADWLLGLISFLKFHFF